MTLLGFSYTQTWWKFYTNIIASSLFIKWFILYFLFFLKKPSWIKYAYETMDFYQMLPLPHCNDSAFEPLDFTSVWMTSVIYLWKFHLGGM